MTPITSIPDTTENNSQALGPEVLAGFWTRILALVIDGLMIGIAGFFLGLMFFDAFVKLGGWGRLIGFIIALLYFGILNSHIGGGQTPGKRITRIKVVGRDGRSISVKKSFLRYTILDVPFFLNGAMIPLADKMTASSIVIGMIIFGVGGAIIYLYIFNRRTRQSLHDVATGTFVVRASVTQIPADVGIWKYHFAILSLWILIILIFTQIINSMILPRGPFPELLAVHKSIRNSGKVHDASVFSGTSWDDNGERKYLTAIAIWKNKPASIEAATSEIAFIILKEDPDIMDKDIVTVSVTYGFDIGIASGWRKYNESHSPAEWKQKLR